MHFGYLHCMRSHAVALVLALGLFAAACHPTGDVKVAGVAFEGNTAFGDGELAKVITTRKSGWLPWSRKFYFDREQFEADLGRLRRFYADRGYPNARVSVADISFNEAKDAVSVRIAVDEGTPVIVERIEITGVDHLDAAVRDQLASLPLREGAPRDKTRLAESVERAAYVLKDNGYPHARVQASERAGTDPNRVTVTLAATPGDRTTFGDVSVVGNKSVSDNVIHRAVGFRPGQLYRESRVLESQRRLAALELFDFAHVTGRTEAPPDNGSLPMVVTVAEGKPTRLDLGIGYGTEDGPRGSIQWKHHNFLGDARQFMAEGKYSTRSRGAGIDFVEPFFLARRLSLGFNAGAWWTTEPVFYRSRTLGGRTTLTYRLVRPVRARRGTITHIFRVGYVNEAQHYTINEDVLADPTLFDELIALGLDPTSEAGSGRRASLDFDIERTAVDNALNPRSGHVLIAHFVNAATWLGGTYRYHEIAGEGRLYLPIGASRVLATRVRGGTLRADEPIDIPFTARYFLGGSQSLRGWGRFEVSPLTRTGQPIGGETMLEISSEVRQMFGDTFGAVLFVDAGNVWRLGAPSDLGSLHVAVGPGLRYASPFGIVRADLGIQLTRIPGLLVNGEPEPRRWRIHFSIGHIF